MKNTIATGVGALTVLGFSLAIPPAAAPQNQASPPTIASGAHFPGLRSIAPDFNLSSLSGHRHSLSETRGHTEVLGFFCGCNRCYDAATRIAAMQKKGMFLCVAVVIALDPADASRFMRETGLRADVFLDESDETAEKYDSDFCPRLWGLTANGRIAYRSQRGLEGASLTRALVALATFASYRKPRL